MFSLTFLPSHQARAWPLCLGVGKAEGRQLGYWVLGWASPLMSLKCVLWVVNSRFGSGRGRKLVSLVCTALFRFLLSETSAVILGRGHVPGVLRSICCSADRLQSPALRLFSCFCPWNLSGGSSPKTSPMWILSQSLISTFFLYLSMVFSFLSGTQISWELQGNCSHSLRLDGKVATHKSRANSLHNTPLFFFSELSSFLIYFFGCIRP